MFAFGAIFPLLGFPALLIPAFVAGAIGMLLGGCARMAAACNGKPLSGLASLKGIRLPAYGSWALRAMLVAIIAVTAVTIVRAQLLTPLSSEGFAQSTEAMKLPWISMAMADLYAGFFVTSLWLVYREGRVWLAAILIANLWFWGNIVLASYLLALSFHNPLSVRGLLLRPTA